MVNEAQMRGLRAYWAEVTQTPQCGCGQTGGDVKPTTRPNGEVFYECKQCWLERGNC